MIDLETQKRLAKIEQLMQQFELNRREFELHLQKQMVEIAQVAHLNADATLKRQTFNEGWLKFYLSAVVTAAALMGVGAGFFALVQKL